MESIVTPLSFVQNVSSFFPIRFSQLFGFRVMALLGDLPFICALQVTSIIIMIIIITICGSSKYEHHHDL